MMIAIKASGIRAVSSPARALVQKPRMSAGRKEARNLTWPDQLGRIANITTGGTSIPMRKGAVSRSKSMLLISFLLFRLHCLFLLGLKSHYPGAVCVSLTNAARKNALCCQGTCARNVGDAGHKGRGVVAISSICPAVPLFLRCGGERFRLRGLSPRHGARDRPRGA